MQFWHYKVSKYDKEKPGELEHLHSGEPAMNDARVGIKFLWGKWAVGGYFGAVKTHVSAIQFNWVLEIE